MNGQTTEQEDHVNATTPDLTAATADRRHQKLAILETRARTYTGPVLCTLCGNHLNPVGEGTPCRCPDPQVQTPDEAITHLRGVVAYLTDEVETTRRRLADETARADETAAMERLARRHAADMEGVLAYERRQVAWFVQVAGTLLGNAGRVPVSETAARLAQLLRPVG